MSKRARIRKRLARCYTNYDSYVLRMERKFKRYDKSAKSDRHMHEYWKNNMDGWVRTRAPFHKGKKPWA